MGSLTTLMTTISEKVINAEFWMAVGWGLLKIVLFLVLAKVVIRVVNAFVHNVLFHRAVRLDERRTKTISTMLINITRYVVYFFVVLTVLANFGIDITTLIAGAGVAGLAIGFGAQSLVKDVITGFFIIFEDQFGVGDNVMINMNPNIRGTVQGVGLRITKVRAYTGEIHVLSNSQILQVTNYSKTNSLAVIDVSVAFEEDLQRVFDVLRKVGEEVKETNEKIVGEPEVLGVQTFGAHEVVVRMTIETLPMEHYGVGRDLRKRIKEVFDEEGIEIPYPKQVLLGKPGETGTVAGPAQAPKPEPDKA